MSFVAITQSSGRTQAAVQANTGSSRSETKLVGGSSLVSSIKVDQDGQSYVFIESINRAPTSVIFTPPFDQNMYPNLATQILVDRGNISNFNFNIKFNDSPILSLMTPPTYSGCTGDANSTGFHLNVSLNVSAGVWGVEIPMHFVTGNYDSILTLSSR